MGSSRTVLRRYDSSPDEAAHLRAVAWSFVFRCWREKQTAVELDGHNNAAIVTKVEGGNSVNRDGATTQPRNDATKESKK
jgi:hypothetical protein